MTIQLLEQIMTESGNDDRYWLRHFDAGESSNRVYQSEGRGIVAHVETGAELGWARTYIGHGAWYSYLWKCRITPDTAQRRIRDTLVFMKFAGIKTPSSRHDKEPWVLAIELIHEKPCKLQDFSDYQRMNLNRNEFLPPTERAYHREFQKFILNPDPARVADWVRTDWRHWNSDMRAEVIEAISLTIDIYRGLIASLKGKWEDEVDEEIKDAELYLQQKAYAFERLALRFRPKKVNRSDFEPEDETE